MADILPRLILSQDGRGAVAYFIYKVSYDLINEISLRHHAFFYFDPI